MNTDRITRRQLASMIDHAVLKPDATLGDVRAACDLVKQYEIGALFVRPCDLAEAHSLLSGSEVRLGSVVGFPHGSSHTNCKAAEAQQAVADGADELDMVVNVARLKDGQLDYVRNDIAAVVAAAEGRTVKVILECCYLTRSEMRAGCAASAQAGAAFVKTSTGFAAGGARIEDVRFLREQVGDRLSVKAAGGIRTLADALAMIRAGADRIGTSSTEDILQELPD